MTTKEQAYEAQQFTNTALTMFGEWESVGRPINAQTKEIACHYMKTACDYLDEFKGVTGKFGHLIARLERVVDKAMFYVGSVEYHDWYTATHPKRDA